jgi:hypothetical protein
MRKVLLVAVALLSLAWGRTVMAQEACTSDAACNPTGGSRVCVCPDNSGQPPSPSPSQCGSTEVIPGVLEISGAANSAGVAGCVEVAETVAIGGSPSSPIVAPVVGTHAECDAAANAACVANGCGVCADSAEP